MRHKIIRIFAAALLLATACKAPQMAQPSGAAKEAIAVTAVAGSYFGTTPCADCPGVVSLLTLHPDQSYSETLHYLDREVAAVTTSGRWKMNRGEVLLLGPSERRLKPGINSLTILDGDGHLIPQPLGRRFVLHRCPAPPAAEAMLELARQGSAFTATGNAPNWNLRYDNHQQLVLELKDRAPLIFGSITEKTSAVNPSVRTIEATNEKQQINVAIVGRPADQFSTTAHELAVHITLAENGITVGELSGCGYSLYDPRLKDIWIVTQLNGSDLKTKSGNTSLPTLEFHPDRGELLGYGGCNQLNGSIEVEGNRITFGPIRSTKKACPDLATEIELLQTVANKTMIYQLREGTLQLLVGDKVVAALKKTD